MLLDFNQLDQGDNAKEPDAPEQGEIVKRSKLTGIDVAPLTKQGKDLQKYPDIMETDPCKAGFTTLTYGDKIFFALIGRDPDGCGPVFTSHFYVLSAKAKVWERGRGIYCINQTTGSIQDLGYAGAGQSRCITNAHINSVLRAVLQHNTIRFDEVKRIITIGGKHFNMDDAKVLNLQLSEQYQVNFADVKGSIFQMARENTYNSFREELDRIEKEVEPYSIEAFCNEVLCIKDPLYIQMFRLQLVATITRAGAYKSEKWGLLWWRQLLTLIGAQGTGKDNLIEFLFNAEVTTAPPVPNLSKRDYQKSMNKNMVLRFGEVNKYVRSSKDLETLKDWLSEKTYTWTDKWMIDDTTEFRRSCCWASSNDTKWLSDPTGNTRFWNIVLPFRESVPMDLDRVKELREGLWASAIKYARLYEQGEWCPYLCDDFFAIQDQLKETEQEHTISSPYVDDFRKYLEDDVKVLSNEHIEQITGLDKGNFSRKGTERTQLQMALKEIGFAIEPKRINFIGPSGCDNRRYVFIRDGANCQDLTLVHDHRRKLRSNHSDGLKIV